MFGLGLADESLGPPEFADGGTFAHFATSASTPAAFFLVPRVQPLKRHQWRSNWPGTLVGTNGTKILPTAHWSHWEMHPIGQMPSLRFHQISWRRCKSAILFFYKTKRLFFIFPLFALKKKITISCYFKSLALLSLIYFFLLENTSLSQSLISNFSNHPFLPSSLYLELEVGSSFSRGAKLVK